MAVIKASAWFYMRRSEGGNVEAVPFATKAAAEQCAEDWEEMTGVERLPLDIYFDTLEIDNDRVIPPNYVMNEY